MEAMAALEEPQVLLDDTTDQGHVATSAFVLISSTPVA